MYKSEEEREREIVCVCVKCTAERKREIMSMIYSWRVRQSDKAIGQNKKEDNKKVKR
jgi:hypothetical protein